jgi:hypothetical protein
MTRHDPPLPAILYRRHEHPGFQGVSIEAVVTNIAYMADLYGKSFQIETAIEIHKRVIELAAESIVASAAIQARLAPVRAELAGIIADAVRDHIHAAVTRALAAPDASKEG